MDKTIASLLNIFSEADILLAHQLGVSRTYLYAHSEKKLSQNEQADFLKLIERRKKGEPFAYLTGKREFWSLDLEVTPDTLIPRPETEILVEWALALCAGSIVADLGTGSGAIALALGHTKPHWIIHGTDNSRAALSVAKKNAARLDIRNVSFYEGNWCAALPHASYDMIVSNPPYIAKDDMHLQKSVLDYEPYHALIAEDNGLFFLKEIIHQAISYLKPGGYLLLEHGFQQADEVRAFLNQQGFSDIETKSDLSGLARVTFGNK